MCDGVDCNCGTISRKPELDGNFDISKSQKICSLRRDWQNLYVPALLQDRHLKTSHAGAVVRDDLYALVKKVVISGSWSGEEPSRHEFKVFSVLEVT